MDQLATKTSHATRFCEIIDEERKRINDENDRKHGIWCLKKWLSLFGLLLLAAILMMVLDLSGVRNGDDCKVNRAMGQNDWHKSVFGGWRPECYECKEESQVMDPSKRFCVYGPCPGGRNPKVSHLIKEKNLTVRFCSNFP